MSRLFVAIWPPDHVIETLRELPRKDQRGVRFVPPENWHITLRFLGECRIDEASEAVDEAVFEPARARLGPAVDLLGTRAVVVPVGGLDDLAAAVDTVTGDLGDVRRPRRFVGHLTLARVKRHHRVGKIVGLACDAEFDVAEVALVESRLHPSGARYETIATWPVGTH